MKERWWAWPVYSERLYAGLHWSTWKLGVELSFNEEQFVLYVGPVTLGVSWWA